MFRESKATGRVPARAANAPTVASGPNTPDNEDPQREPIGALIGRSRKLSIEQVEQIASHQRQHHLRFGESAIALGLANADDVLHALSQQFRYAYAKGAGADHHPDLVSALRPFSPQAEAFRGIRAQLKLRLTRPGTPRRAVAVLSAGIGEGKSTFAANNAIAFSQLGGRTLLIDADLRRPRQHELFGIADDGGLANVLAGRTDSHVIHPVAALPSLFVLPVGTVPPNPLELLEGGAFAALLQDVLGKFDHVVVDTPAFSHGMDAAVVADACGVGLIVVRRGRSRLSGVQDLVALVSESRAEVAGVIMNEF